MVAAALLGLRALHVPQCAPLASTCKPRLSTRAGLKVSVMHWIVVCVLELIILAIPSLQAARHSQTLNLSQRLAASSPLTRGCSLQSRAREDE